MTQTSCCSRSSVVSEIGRRQRAGRSGNGVRVPPYCDPLVTPVPDEDACLTTDAEPLWLHPGLSDIGVARRAIGREIVGGVVVSAGSLVPQQGDPQPALRARALLQAAAAEGLMAVEDPETACLVSLTEAGASATAGSESVELPLDPRLLLDRDRRDIFVDSVLAAQSSAALAAPYLRLARLRGPELEIDLRMLERTVLHSDGRPVVAFAEITLEALRAGLPAACAARYAISGADLLVLRVVDWDAALATSREAEALVAAIHALRSVGLRVVVEDSGDVACVLVAAGLHACVVAVSPTPGSVGTTHPRPLQRLTDLRRAMIAARDEPSRAIAGMSDLGRRAVWAQCLPSRGRAAVA